MSNARRDYRRSCLLATGMLFLAGPLAAQIQTSPLAGRNGTAIIIAQTSSGGSNTHLIDRYPTGSSVSSKAWACRMELRSTPKAPSTT